jgi:hypothetical protein
MKELYYVICRDGSGDMYVEVDGPYKTVAEAKKEADQFDVEPERTLTLISMDDGGNIKQLSVATSPKSKWNWM